MKTLLYIVTVIMLATSCSQSKIAKSEKGKDRESLRIAEQEAIKKAVEAGEFTVLLDRIYSDNGGFTYLLPSRNFISVSGTEVVMRAAYLGRQYDMRPVQGIKLAGKKSTYEMNSDPEGKGFKIKMVVEKNGNKFDIYIDINKTGNCTVWVNNIRIDNVKYSGQIETEVDPVPGASDLPEIAI